jgi:hypothetical protein
LARDITINDWRWYLNIFILDTNPELAAQYHCDKHVVKMILESAQLLSTALYLELDRSYLYKPTHINHPCNVWLRESFENIIWLIALAKALGKEYTFRFNKTHKSMDIINYIIDEIDFNREIVTIPKTFALAMPDECIISDNAVNNYRQYYRTSKLHLLKYTRREFPDWI